MTSTLIEQDICILCSKSVQRILISKEVLSDRVNVLQCPGCKLVFLESRAMNQELDPEETAYWDGGIQKDIYLQKAIQKSFLIEFVNRLETIERFARVQGKLLDVGCGVGHFLDTARKRGWQVHGSDISRMASKAAGDVYGLDVQVGTLDKSEYKSGEFSVITLWDVIEHIRRPLENLKAANRLLRKNGLLVLKTPNEDGFYKQFSIWLYRLLGKRGSFLLKYVYYVPHYFSYSKKTMNLLLRQAGFEAVCYEMDATPMEFAQEKIQAHYGKDPKRKFVIALLPVARFLAQMLRMNNKMTVYAKKVKEVI